MKKPEQPPSIDSYDAILNLFGKQTLGKPGGYLKFNNIDFKSIDRDYLYWEEFKYKVKGSNEKPEALWDWNKLLRNINANLIKISDLPIFNFKYNVTDKIQQQLHEFDLNLGWNLHGEVIPSEDKDKYLISSIMEEAIASSQIEGAVTTREKAKEMLRQDRKPVNKSERMIVNNYLTIKRILELKDKPLTKEMILEIHSMMTEDTLNNAGDEGRFRTNNDIDVVDELTKEVFYSPPDYKYLDEVITAFCRFANSDNKDEFIHPIIRASILHFLIGYIHPFVDGNGRTARAIFYWYMLSKGYWLTEYVSISRIINKSRTQYNRAYLHTEYDENDLTYFIIYQLEKLKLAYNDLEKYIERKRKEKAELFNIIKTEEVNNRQLEIIRSFINDSNKTMTIKEAQTSFNVFYETARTDLLNLVEMKFLSMKKIGKTFTFFKSDEFDKKVRARK